MNISAFVPARRLGIMAYDMTENERMTWAIGAFATDISDTAGNTQILAGEWIDIYGDHLNLDPGIGTVMHFHGTITPGLLTSRLSFITRTFGNVDDDQTYFDQTYLGGKTRSYGSNAPTECVGEPTSGASKPCGVDG